MKHPRTKQSGVTIIELMIAMVLGLFLLAGILTIFVSSKQAYRTNDALARVQESGRFALEFLSRDIRMAGMTGCAATDRIANTLNDQASWWSDFSRGGIDGYPGVHDASRPFPRAFGTAVADRVNDTDAFVLRGGQPRSFAITNHNPNSATFVLSEAHNLTPGSIIMVCDNRQASIFQHTGGGAANQSVSLVHNPGQGTPGNCTVSLGYPSPTPPCGPGNTGTPYQYGPDSNLVLYNAVAYYIGWNPSGGRSLYRISLENGLGTPQELVEGVHDMRLTYGLDSNGDRQLDGNYVEAAAVGTANWNNVVAARINLLAISAEQQVTPAGGQTIAFAGGNVAVPNNRLAQVFTSTVGLRNRLP